MKMNKTAIIACAIILGATSLNASAIDINVTIGAAPPPVKYEVMPAPRDGNLWVPGFWDWNGSKHTWVQGNWEKTRPGYVYVKPEWQKTNNGWHLAKGHWKNGKNGSHKNKHNGKHGDYDVVQSHSDEQHKNHKKADKHDKHEKHDKKSKDK